MPASRAGKLGGGAELQLPQVRDLDKLRLLLRLLRQGRTDPADIGRQMGAGENYPARHATYYREAADVLGLVEPRRWMLTAAGVGLLATEPGGEDEREMLRGLVASASRLGKIGAAVLAEEEPDVPSLVAWAEPRSGLGRDTLERRIRDVLSWRRRLHSAAPPRPRPYVPGVSDVPGVAQLDLLTRAPAIDPKRWPDPDRLPYNWPLDRISVERVVYRDLHAAEEVLVVAGYASLERICEMVASLAPESPRRVRIVFGTEPYLGRTRAVGTGSDTLSPEVRDYWLERGVSIVHARAVLRTIEALRAGRLTTRVSRRSTKQHAKIFLTPDAATVGSSNFTDPGLAGQLEANVRLVAHGPTRVHFEEASRLAGIYWDLAVPFDAELAELLEKLLRKVTWQEALARACAELLEGEWARAHLRDDLRYADHLWPSQIQGIGQALYVLLEVGSVLVADATGSGKTRTGSWLLRALREQLVSMGRSISDPVLVAPPAVTDTWADELQHADVRIPTHSQGVLSSARAGGYDRVRESVETARILALDEAHNFINPSARTAIVNTTLADHVILFTATPINRDVSDLVGIVDLLGADNFDDETLGILENTGWRRGRPLEEEEKARLRTAVMSFTVRRTKRDFNALIDREPQHYVNREGDACRYPENVAEYYELHESKTDREIAGEITRLARSLDGVLMLAKPIALTKAARDQGWTPERWVSMRLASAKALARYQVRLALRSSRAALWEHLRGTEAAGDKYGVRPEKEETGDVIARLKELQKGEAPGGGAVGVLARLADGHGRVSAGVPGGSRALRGDRAAVRSAVGGPGRGEGAPLGEAVEGARPGARVRLAADHAGGARGHAEGGVRGRGAHGDGGPPCGSKGGAAGVRDRWGGAVGGGAVLELDVRGDQPAGRVGDRAPGHAERGADRRAARGPDRPDGQPARARAVVVAERRRGVRAGDRRALGRATRAGGRRARVEPGVARGESGGGAGGEDGGRGGAARAGAGAAVDGRVRAGAGAGRGRAGAGGARGVRGGAKEQGAGAVGGVGGAGAGGGWRVGVLCDRGDEDDGAAVGVRGGGCGFGVGFGWGWGRGRRGGGDGAGGRRGAAAGAARGGGGRRAG